MTLSYALCVGLVRFGRAFSVARLRRALSFVSVHLVSRRLSLSRLSELLFAALRRSPARRALSCCNFPLPLRHYSTLNSRHSSCSTMQLVYGSIWLSRSRPACKHQRISARSAQQRPVGKRSPGSSCDSLTNAI